MKSVILRIKTSWPECLAILIIFWLPPTLVFDESASMLLYLPFLIAPPALFIGILIWDWLEALLTRDT